MIHHPEVSVVIPTRNRSRLLSRALASALGQRDVELEVMVVDDGSRDETPIMLSRHRDARVRRVRHEDPRGVAAARNRGVHEAHGEWVAFLDDDDTWSPTKLRTQLAALHSTGATVAYGSAVHVDERGTVIAVERAPDPGELAPRLLTNQNPVPAGCSNVIARMDLVRRIGGFDDELFHLADWDMWLRLVEQGRPVACTEIVVAYLKHSANMLTVPDRDIFREFRYLAAKHRAQGAARGLRFDGVGLSCWVASGHRRSGRRLAAARAYLRGAVLFRSAGNAARAVNVIVNPRATGAAPASTKPLALDRPSWLEFDRPG